MYCAFCGKEKNENSSFCGHCGNQSNKKVKKENKNKLVRGLFVIFIIIPFLTIFALISYLLLAPVIRNHRVSNMLEEKYGEKFTYVRRGFVTIGSDHFSGYWKSNKNEGVTFEVLTDKDYSKITDKYANSLAQKKLSDDLMSNLGELSVEYIAEVRTYAFYAEKSFGSEFNLNDYFINYEGYSMGYYIFFKEKPTDHDLEKVYFALSSAASKYPLLDADVYIYLDTNNGFHQFGDAVKYANINFGKWDSEVRDFYDDWLKYSATEDKYYISIKEGTILADYNQPDQILEKEDFLMGSFKFEED